MELVLCLLVNSLFFLLCSGVWYLSSSLVRVFIILVMKVLSLDFTTELALTCLLSSVVRDIKAGIVLAEKAQSGSELSDGQDPGVEALMDALGTVEASEVFASSETQKVQFEIVRWYLLFP